MPKRRSRSQLTSLAPEKRRASVALSTKPLPLFAAGSKRTIENLKVRHRLPEDFDLARKLRSIEYAARDLRIQPMEKLGPASQDSSMPSALQLKRFLAGIQSSVKSLHPRLENAGEAELSLLIYGIPGPPNSAVSRGFSYADLVQLTHLLASLDRSARAASLKSLQPGRRPNIYLTHIARRLRELYVEAFGPKAPRITKGSKYSGRFFAFMRDVLPLFGVRKMENGSLGRLCEASIEEVDKA